MGLEKIGIRVSMEELGERSCFCVLWLQHTKTICLQYLLSLCLPDCNHPLCEMILPQIPSKPPHLNLKHLCHAERFSIPNHPIPSSILVNLLCNPSSTIVSFRQCRDPNSTHYSSSNPVKVQLVQLHLKKVWQILPSVISYALANEGKNSLCLLHQYIYLCCHLRETESKSL